MIDEQDDQELILAAEDCDPRFFSALHRFSQSDEKLITKLIAHGPVLLRGGRGSGKSALMIESHRRMSQDGSKVFGVYLSLRHLALLKSKSGEYERALCDIIVREIKIKLAESELEFGGGETVDALQRSLSDLSAKLAQRIVLFFDDAAHIGREASLAEFFDLFRTISSNTVSCKAAIYPGVTRFGTRFDVFNDATVLDVSRSEELPGYKELFLEIMNVRFEKALPDSCFSGDLSRQEVGAFLGQAVLANMRAFVFACNNLSARVKDRVVGLKDLGDVLMDLAANHFWPLLEELKPKLGVYEPMVDPAREIAEVLFNRVSNLVGRRSALVHRDFVEGLSKPFEMLEYAGFISKREASKVLKKGGRGARYAMNLCNLLERMPGRLTRDVYERWMAEKYLTERLDPVELNKGSELAAIKLPEMKENAELGILAEPIDRLKKSLAYPYGLTEIKIDVLKGAGIKTVGALASATDAVLLELDGVGDKTLVRLRNVVGQAIWM